MDPKRTLAYRKEKDYFSSASQIKTYRDCPRKWGFQKIANPPHPRHTDPNLEFGTDGHDRWGDHYLNGTPLLNDDLGRTMMQGVKYAPLRDPETQTIEGKFTIQVDQGIYLVGFIDVEGPALVLDWKFTGSLRWAMGTAAFEEDPQRIIYVRHKLRTAKEVEARWIYMSASKKAGTTNGRPRTPKGARMVAGTYTWKDIRDLYYAIEDQVREMATYYRKVEDPMDLEPCYQNCGKFGGCEFKALCAPSGKDVLKAAFRQHAKTHLTKSVAKGTNDIPKNPKEKKMGLFDKLKDNATKDTEEDVVDLLNQGAPAPEAPIDLPADARFITACLGCQVEPGEPCQTALGNESKRIHGERKKTNLNLDFHGLPYAALAKLDPLNPQAPVNAPSSEEAAVAQVPVNAQPMEEATTPFVLYVDCRPSKGLETTSLFSELLPVMQKVAEANEVAHWNLIPYAQGGPLLAQAVGEVLPLAGAFTIDSSSPLARACLDVLEHFADQVVWG